MRFLALLALVAFVPVASAQVGQGQLELSGSAEFSSTEGNTYIAFNPSLGYFITDALEAGGELFYVKSEGSDGYGSIGPFAAYHFGAAASNVRPFVQANVGIGLSEGSDITFGGAGGVKYFFLPGGALRGQVFVNTDGDFTTVGLSGGVSIFI